ncbi:MAG TPA: hypothetical protein PLQ97_10585 [Myxococcota bacterium]|nr:hypothetical protein [Myxococcota bacterium]HQK51242.1 hypothetical protein [Myxococcota bacterium]
MTTLRTLLPALLMTLPVAACGDGSDSTTTDTSVFQVTWADNARLVSETDGKAHLKGNAPGPDTLEYRFDGGATAIEALQPGQVAVLAGIAYRKVVEVRREGDDIVLATARTTLPEAIRDGTMEWNLPVDFARAAQSGALRVTYGDAELHRVSSALEGGISWEGELEGWNLAVRLVPSTGRLDVEATAKKKVLGEDRIGLNATGHVEGLRLSGRVGIAGGVTETFQAAAQDVRGQLHVKAAAFNAGASQELLRVPLGIDVPVEIGPVPLIVKIKAHVNVTAELALNDSEADAEVDFAFDAHQGIRLAGSSIAPDANLDSFSAENILGGAADYVAAGMSACLEFPRLEVAMAGEFASVGLSQNNCVSAFYSFDPACNQVKGTVTGVALYNVGFWGITLAGGQVELYKQERERHAGNCR